MASSNTPKPSATPNVPAGYDTATNFQPSHHINTTPNGYQNSPSSNEDEFNPSRSITATPNGTVISAKHAQSTHGHVGGTTHVPAATSSIGK